MTTVSVANNAFPKRRSNKGSVRNPMASKISIQLKRPELISFISFDMASVDDDMHCDAVIHYFVDVKCNHKWQRVCDRSICLTTELQEIDFKTKLLVSNIVIIGINLSGIFKIRQLSYKLKSKQSSNDISAFNTDINRVVEKFRLYE
jgi:hypothetical protein